MNKHSKSKQSAKHVNQTVIQTFNHHDSEAYSIGNDNISHGFQ